MYKAKVFHPVQTADVFFEKKKDGISGDGTEVADQEYRRHRFWVIQFNVRKVFIYIFTQRVISLHICTFAKHSTECKFTDSLSSACMPEAAIGSLSFFNINGVTKS